jgi:hypothetical protein
MFAEKIPSCKTAGSVFAGMNVAKTALIGEREANTLPTMPILLLGTKQRPRHPVTPKTNSMLETIAPIEPLDRIDQSKPNVVQKAM